MKRVFRKKAKINKGMSSAVLLSILIHGALFFLAGLLVVFTVVKQKEVRFDPPKAVERPKMKLKKPQVKVKKSSRPKPTARIVTKANKAVMPDIQLPEMSGIGDGLGGAPGGFSLMPELDDISVFGSGQSIGNDFEGVVYSLVRDRAGRKIPMSDEQFRSVLREYILSGWKNSVLSHYYCLPKKLYTTHFMVPVIPTCLAPTYFGDPLLEDYYLFAKYEGKLVYKEDITFRFWGVGDAYLFVNVAGREVLMNTWAWHQGYFDWWQSSAGGDRTYLLGNQRMVVGDWIELKAGKPVDMKVLYGEFQGGMVEGMLLVEVKGMEYPSSRSNGPLLPAFKTDELSWETITEISRFLPAGECTLTNGPVFNDYYLPSVSPTPVASRAPEEPEPEKENAVRAAASGVRFWMLADGSSLEAEFETVVAGNAVLKNKEGRQIRIPMERLSEADRSLVCLSLPPDLEINFAKTAKKREFGDTFGGGDPPVRANITTFSAQIQKKSIQPYGLGLTAELFAIGEEVGGNKRILLDYQTAEFTLMKENNYTFEVFCNPVELIDYTINDERRGIRYSGHLVVVSDRRGEIIAHTATSKNLFENLDNLQKIKVGWYFDNDCNPCLPTPPKPWADQVMNN